MKIKTFGYRSQVSPLKKMEETFISLGHEIVQDGECDLIFDLIFDLTGGNRL